MAVTSVTRGKDNLKKLLDYPEVGIYKRTQESKKTRKQELDQESDQEKKKVVSFFLGRILVFLIELFFSFFLTFLFSFINSHLCSPRTFYPKLTVMMDGWTCNRNQE